MSAKDPGPWTPLPAGYRRRFPFRLAVPSFVYPADWATNVRRLGPCVDEVELLFFEGAPGSLPAGTQVTELARLKESLNLAYNVHLPSDAPLASRDETRRREAVAAVRRTVDATRELSPTTLTLHLDPSPDARDRRTRPAWLDRLRRSLDTLLQAPPAPRDWSVETLLYPFEWVEPLVAEYDLGVCIDTGHLWRQGIDPATVFRRHAQRVAIFHLHAETAGCDHLPLDRLSAARRDALRPLLGAFTGTVSLELFSFEALVRSLHVLPHLV